MTLRILLTLPNFRTAGSQHVLLALYHSFKNEGHKVFVLIEDSTGNFPELIEKRDQLVIVKQTYSNLREGLNYVKKLSAVLKQLKIDVVHSWDYRSELWEVLACRLSGTAYIYTKKNNSWSKKWWLKSFFSKHIAFDQPEMADRFFSHPLLRKKTTFITHGVDTNVFKHDAKIKKPSGIIGCIGNIVSNKNQILILKALLRIEPGIRCVFYGNSEAKYLSELRTFITENKLENRVEFKGYINNNKLPAVINQLDILILASFNEGLPVTLLEAISCGTYCIASDSGGGTKYIFDLCKTGALFDPSDDLKLSELIKEYYHDSTSKESEAKKAIAVVESQFSATYEAQKYLSLFKRIVD